MPLSQVIANDRAYKLKQDSQREEQKDVSDFVAFLLPFGTKRQNKELSSSNSSLSSTSETPNESTSPNTPEPAPRARRRVSRPITRWCMPVSPEGLAGAGENPVVSVDCGVFLLSCSNSDFFLGGSWLGQYQKILTLVEIFFLWCWWEKIIWTVKVLQIPKWQRDYLEVFLFTSFIYLLLYRSLDSTNSICLQPHFFSWGRLNLCDWYIRMFMLI